MRASVFMPEGYIWTIHIYIYMPDCLTAPGSGVDNRRTDREIQLQQLARSILSGLPWTGCYQVTGTSASHS